jgi:hypothetical protein
MRRELHPLFIQVSQIVRVMNEHTDTLQWIEDKTESVKNAVQNVIKGHKEFKKEHEYAVQCLLKKSS